jgi:hypothetical protein
MSPPNALPILVSPVCVQSVVRVIWVGCNHYVCLCIYFGCHVPSSLDSPGNKNEGEFLIGKIVATGQETVQGSSNKMRFDLFKKHLSGDPIAMRLLYSIVTKMQELTGWKRYEMNLLPTFDGVTDDNFNSVMRRALVIRHLARFIDPLVWQGPSLEKRVGLFSKDPTAKDFVRSGPAVVAMWKVLHGHMRKYSMEDSARSIEE